MTLWDLSTKKNALIAQLDHTLHTNIAQRLREMGFDNGQSVRCVRRAPFNGPLVVQLSGSVISLERAIAERIEITD